MKLHSLNNTLLVCILLPLLIIAPTVLSAQTTNTSNPTDFKIKANSPPTARNIDKFITLNKNNSVNDIVAVVGKPDEDIGSGLFVFVYKLDDGTKVLIGATALNQPPLYILHVMKDGHKEYIYKRKNL